MAENPKASKSSETPHAGKSREFPAWKKVLLTSAVFLVVAGLGLRGYEAVRSDGPAGQQLASDHKNVDTGVGNSFLPGVDVKVEKQEGETPAAAEPADASKWSPVLMKGGAGFLVGFCIGFALRTFARLSAVVVGLVLLALFGLSQGGLITVDWAAIEASFQSAVATIQKETSGLGAFVAGSLPVAGMAGAGIFTGFKKS
jgi:uncharacterized membrane protein (Fun14 family)